MRETNYPFENNLVDSADSVTAKVNDLVDDVSNKASTLKAKTQEIGRAAVDKIDQNRAAAADALRSTASSIHDNAGKFPNGPAIAHSAAARVDRAADYLESRDANQLLEDVVGVVKNNPLPSLLIAGVAGFLVGRALRSK